MAAALTQVKVSTNSCDSLAGDLNYAEGGARDARCRETELLGATCGGSEENRAISSGAATRSRPAAASAGMCSVWQIWQAVSGPFVWRWRMLPPAAKYSSTAHANTASARRASVRPNMALRRCITLHISVTPLTLKPAALVHKLDPYPPALLDPATIFRHAPAKRVGVKPKHQTRNTEVASVA